MKKCRLFLLLTLMVGIFLMLTSCGSNDGEPLNSSNVIESSSASISSSAKESNSALAQSSQAASSSALVQSSQVASSSIAQSSIVEQSSTVASSDAQSSKVDSKDVTVTYKSYVASGSFSETVSKGSYTLPGYAYIAEKFTPTISYEYIAGYIIDGVNYNFNDSINITKDTEIIIFTSSNYTIRTFVELPESGNLYNNLDYFDVDVNINNSVEYITFPSESIAKANGLIVPDNYKFVGWNYTSAEGDVAFNKVSVHDFLLVSYAGMIYIRPVFKFNEYTLTIKREETNNTCSGDEIKITVGKDGYVLPDPLESNFEIETLGYYFTGFEDSKDSSIVYSIGDTITLTSDTTLYVKTSNKYYFRFCCMSCSEYVTEEVTFGQEFTIPKGSEDYSLGSHTGDIGKEHTPQLEYGMSFMYWTTHELYDDLDEKIYQDTTITVNFDWIKDFETKSTTFYKVVRGKYVSYAYHDATGKIVAQTDVINSGEKVTLIYIEGADNSTMDSYNSRLIGWSLKPNSLTPDYVLDQEIIVRYNMDGVINLYPVYGSVLLGTVYYADPNSNLVIIEKANFPIYKDSSITFINPDTGASHTAEIVDMNVRGKEVESSKVGDMVTLTLSEAFTSRQIDTFYLAVFYNTGYQTNEVIEGLLTFTDESYIDKIVSGETYYIGVNGHTATKTVYYSLKLTFKNSEETGLERNVSLKLAQYLIISYYDTIDIFIDNVDEPAATITYCVINPYSN